MLSSITKPEAILCDRDGTLIEDEHFLSSTKNIRWISGVQPLLKELKQQGIKVLVVTNQSGVARGYFGRNSVEAIHAKLRQDVEATGGTIADFYYCPHHHQGCVPGYSYACKCRKPLPGMFLQAIREHNLQPSRCWVVGDRLRDLEPGLELGMKGFLVQTGYGLQAQKNLSEQTYAGKVTVIPSLSALLPSMVI
ncbi:MAG: HAD family hydrolase [Moorea sp. SIO2B7]|nr:HAD family hydrolase [Moorena sp. SIO2B7]